MRQIDEKVLTDFIAAPTAEEFVTAEFSRYFGTPAGDDAAEIAARAMDRATSGLESLDDEMLDGRELAAVTILFDPPNNDPGDLYTTPVMPSPESLMLLAAQRAVPGTTVIITQTFLDGCRAQSSAVWPFSMDQAVTVTAPFPHDDMHASVFGDEDEEDEDEADEDEADELLAELNLLLHSYQPGWLYRSLNWGVAKLGGDRDPLHAAGVGLALAGALVAIHRFRRSATR